MSEHIEPGIVWSRTVGKSQCVAMITDEYSKWDSHTADAWSELRAWKWKQLANMEFHPPGWPLIGERYGEKAIILDEYYDWPPRRSSEIAYDKLKDAMRKRLVNMKSYPPDSPLIGERKMVRCDCCGRVKDGPAAVYAIVQDDAAAKIAILSICQDCACVPLTPTPGSCPNCEGSAPRELDLDKVSLALRSFTLAFKMPAVIQTPTVVQEPPAAPVPPKE